MTKQALSNPITLRIPQEVLAEIEAIAETTERSRSWVIVRALKTYLMNEGADILAVKQGRQEIENGEYEDFDAVIAELKRTASEKAA
ncbi:CopG family ribbon-helix-helix protein [Agrobacterium rubi]|uniref:Ribbon-helix-helix protein, CopG family n=1 Tax=Agrobacterium rubi TaxID=28099 RepID=A0AAE7QZ22_9HYPH|nr:ribbon-helix-helix protein, CopG family [Agrobacterium rubi]NTE86631.1 ribbon-helix-helix protein, CopG family [Agrobacterium rubi]NTF02563.1 ribbon-helix-helix protein, CopG family [Agrobacterium rubi]NTF07716.1 ribbon-helix-helix protein, CopG family [Agrobacterium rubi]NTF19960.1 ribbon-helix-helix protein, CopG family [Agrobacterium rubi]NTF26931.1 ribbon-helix-helix protein, CopG family [Agrobacterium rubi]